MKPRFTQKYRRALETAQLYNLHVDLNRDSLYAALQKHFTWYPALKQWLSHDNIGK